MTKQFFKIERNAKLDAAITRAKAGKLFVRPTVTFRRYIVINRENGHAYTVEFDRTASGTKLGRCSCDSKVLCKHLAASLPLHLLIASRRFSQPTN